MDLPYVYKPLDASTQEIRVLDVQPLSTPSKKESHFKSRCRSTFGRFGKKSSKTGTLECTVRHVSLQDDPRPRYETISYCWGGPTLSARIKIDGRLLPVPVQTERALRRMTLPDRCRTLWIDAVCINQKDKEERAQQVSFMGEVFFRSSLNLIYLGEEDSTTEAAIANVVEIVHEVEEVVGSLERLEDVILPNAIPVQATSPMRTKLDFHALHALFARPWFSRLWVLQEALLAPTSLCICGDFTVHFFHLLCAVAWMYCHVTQIPGKLFYPSGIENTLSLWRMSVPTARDREGRESMMLAYLLSFASQRNCTDPRDIVFGMLGLRADCNNEDAISHLLRPDYDKPYVAVLRDATRFCLYEQGNHRMLQRVSHRDNDDLGALGFPSWVPRFDRPYDRLDPPRLSFSYREPDPLDCKEDPSIIGHGDLNKLVLQGFKVDEIQQFTPELTAELLSDSSRMAEMIQSIIEMVVRSDSRSDGQWIIRTLVADRNNQMQKCSAEELAGFKPFFEHLKADGDMDVLWRYVSGEYEALRKAKDFYTAMIWACFLRRAAVTASGRFIGLVPKITRPSDVIVCLHSGRVPFVLRSIGDEYQLIGECYVDGLMYDEEIKAYARDVEEEVFVIR